MSILNDNIEKFMELDVLMKAAANGEIDVNEYRKEFTNEHCYNWSDPGMCFIKFHKIPVDERYVTVWSYLRMHEDFVETIKQVLVRREFVYRVDYTRCHREKLSRDSWYIIEPEYFEHVKSMAGPDQIIRL